MPCCKDTQSPFVGLYFHKIDPKGKIAQQGKIKMVRGNIAFLITFCMFDGGPLDHLETATAEDLFNPKEFKLYDDPFYMRMAFWKSMQHQGGLDVGYEEAVYDELIQLQTFGCHLSDLEKKFIHNFGGGLNGGTI
jgi:hypothetical protein